MDYLGTRKALSFETYVYRRRRRNATRAVRYRTDARDRERQTKEERREAVRKGDGRRERERNTLV